ncbi:MAG: NmrA family transcriptional regulator [Cyclobacteriaceae bacterium]|nr:MAG: NmrA family transcriptional regulator [Cyclobacteriaceae bacterium]
MTNNILVIGGTGKTGRRVVERLKLRNQKVRIGTRGNDPAFDWNNPSTYANALRGMDKAYIVYYPDLAVPGAKEAIQTLVEAAKYEGLEKVVLLSGKGEREAALCEQIVMRSGIEYTIVRSSWFMQNFSESFFLDPILAGYVALPQTKAQVPYVHADDIAEVVVESLLNEVHNGQIYELTGPRTWTFPEVIDAIAKASGREIKFSSTSLEEYMEMLQKLEVPEDYIWLINYLFSQVIAAPGNNVVTGDIEKVLGRKPRDFNEYVKETAKTGVWNQTITQTI